MDKLVNFLIFIYKRYLSNFMIFRILKFFVLKIYYYFYCFKSLVKFHPDSRAHEWQSLGSFHSSNLINKFEIIDEGLVDVKPPRFYGNVGPELYIYDSSKCFISPPQYLCDLAFVKVIGGIDIVVCDEVAIHHDLFVPSIHRCPSEKLGILSQTSDGSCVRLRLTKEPIYLAQAASLIGQCSRNYAHWLTESLPKLPLINLESGSTDLPLLIDSGLHPNILESISFFNTSNRKIIEVEPWRPVHVECLRAVSAPGYERYVPSGLFPSEPEPYQNVFSAFAFDLLRSSASSILDRGSELSDRKIYFRRSNHSSNLRLIANQQEVSDVLALNGVEEFYPEMMSFEQQVRIASSAKMIVGPIGASLVNMIFAPPGCRIIVLAPFYTGASYNFFLNLASVLGHKVSFVLGKPVGEIKQPSQKSYYICKNDLHNALRDSLA